MILFLSKIFSRFVVSLYKGGVGFLPIPSSETFFKSTRIALNAYQLCWSLKIEDNIYMKGV